VTQISSQKPWIISQKTTLKELFAIYYNDKDHSEKDAMLADMHHIYGWWK
jgi:hypothetical protein